MCFINEKARERRKELIKKKNLECMEPKICVQPPTNIFQNNTTKKQLKTLSDAPVSKRYANRTLVTHIARKQQKKAESQLVQNQLNSIIPQSIINNNFSPPIPPLSDTASLIPPPQSPPMRIPQNNCANDALSPLNTLSQIASLVSLPNVVVNPSSLGEHQKLTEEAQQQQQQIDGSDQQSTPKVGSFDENRENERIRQLTQSMDNLAVITKKDQKSNSKFFIEL